MKVVFGAIANGPGNHVDHGAFDKLVPKLLLGIDPIP